MVRDGGGSVGFSWLFSCPCAGAEFRGVTGGTGWGGEKEQGKGADQEREARRGGESQSREHV